MSHWDTLQTVRVPRKKLWTRRNGLSCGTVLYYPVLAQPGLSMHHPVFFELPSSAVAISRILPTAGEILIPVAFRLSWCVFLCVCVCVCVCARARACECAWVCDSARARECACVSVCVWVCMCECVCVCVYVCCCLLSIGRSVARSVGQYTLVSHHFAPP